MQYLPKIEERAVSPEMCWKIAAGNILEKGGLLLEFVIDAIKKAGCEIQMPILITNAEALWGVTVIDDRFVMGE